MAEQGVRFIRRGGRIIPIRDKEAAALAKQHSEGGYGKTAAIGLVSGAVGTGGTAIAHAMKFTKVSNAFRFAGVAGLGYALIGRPMIKGVQVYKEALSRSGDTYKASKAGNRELLKHWGSAYAGSVIGAVGSALTVNPVFRGLVKGALKAKPYTAKYAANRAFKKATAVTAEQTTTALARIYRKR